MPYPTKVLTENWRDGVSIGILMTMSAMTLQEIAGALGLDPAILTPDSTIESVGGP